MGNQYFVCFHLVLTSEAATEVYHHGKNGTI